MAILNNGYVDDMAAYAYARARFPTNFISGTVDNDFRGALYIAGDIINSNNSKFLGQALSSNTGGRAWPREPRTGSVEDSFHASTFLNGIVPVDLMRGYEQLAIGVALSPGTFGTHSSSSATNVVATGGIRSIRYDQMETEYHQGSTTTRTSSGDQMSVPIHLQYHYRQALNYLEKFLRDGETLHLPGIDNDILSQLESEKYATLGQIIFERV